MAECPKSPTGKHMFGSEGCIWCWQKERKEEELAEQISTPSPSQELPELPPVEFPVEPSEEVEEAKPGVEKGPKYKPRKPPTDRRWLDTIRDLVVQATYAISEAKGQATLDEIYELVNTQISEWIATEQWDKWHKDWKVPRKRTVDRRVNEAADKRFAPDGIPKIAAVTSGVYTINPKFTKAQAFIKPFRDAIEKLKRWRNGRKKR